MTSPRKDVVSPNEPVFYHCIARCVRRAFLCGFDRYSSKSYEHRKSWIRRRLAFLVTAFAIECVAYAVMSNHLHSLIRNRPDLAKLWSDAEVARRWLLLFPRRRKPDGSSEAPAQEEINFLVANRKHIAQLRQRLSDISWFNRCLNEDIARRSNREDDVTGRFWEGRFKCQRLATSAAVLACSVYIDLNPIRSGAAKTPEESDFTSIQDRLRKLMGIEATEPGPSLLAHNDIIESGLSATEYAALVDETGRMLVKGKKSISGEMLPLLERLKIKPTGWGEHVRNQGRLFRRVIGPVEYLKNLAAKRKKRWFQGAAAARLVFA